jgi:CubicO group peptidase (beta-lactamase class C family)
MKTLLDRKNVGFQIFFFCSVFLIFVASSNSSDYWPTAGWRNSTPEKQGMDSEKLADMMEKTLTEKYKIDSITVVRNGYIVLDAYFYPFKEDAKHIIHSCTKSITSAAFGIAVDKGHIKNLNQPIIDFFSEKRFANLNADKKAITLKNLLTMASGLKTEDSYLYRWKGLNEMVQQEDWVQYVLDRPMAEKPGSRFEYSNCVTFLLSAIIQKATKQTTFGFIKQHLFKPLGITDVTWVASPNGVSAGYGGMWLKPHDMAKIGWLYKTNGRWDGQQIISEKWVAESTGKQINATLYDGYGYQWWVSYDKFYAAVGHRGQFIYVMPRQNMVVVFTSSLKGADFFIPENLLKKYILPAATAEKPMPENPDQTARLNSYVKKGATSRPYVWKTKEEGVAVDRLFTRTASPAFNLTYPAGSIKTDLDPRLAYQVVAMETLDQDRLAAYVVDVEGNTTLKDFGPNHYLPRFKAYTPKATDIRIISNEEIVLKGNVRAYRIDITYRSEAWPLNLYIVVAQRQNKFVYVTAAGWAGHDLEDEIQAAESLSFE